MPNTGKIILRISALCLLPMLVACGADYTNTLLGTWKDINQERYLTIEKVDGIGSRAIIYVPSGADQAGGDVQAVMNHMSMPAQLQNGILMLQHEAGDIPVLYDPTSQQVVLNGTDKYQRVPEAIAQLKLNPLRDPLKNANH